MTYKNRTSGVASTAGKYASSFALGAKLLKQFDPQFSKLLQSKAVDAFEFGESKPGVCQTAPCRAPYFYEEDNWTDDMELAALQLADMRGERRYLKKGAEFGRMEKTTPWFGSDTARHYQWYPFLNLGHYRLARSGNQDLEEEFVEYMRLGIEAVDNRGKSNPFLYGVPFIWCSNNLAAAIATQCMLYRELTGDRSYIATETAAIDWLFGNNPWGTSMIIGLPSFGTYPKDPHSAFSHLFNYELDGGLVDGPVYSTIFNKLKGVTLYGGDEYAAVQPGMAVYHDDWGDYSTNEPTMDGTASLSYLLSSLESDTIPTNDTTAPEYFSGAIVRTDKSVKRINLIFSGHEYGEGLPVILETLRRRGIHASFFFTGDFYRNPEFEDNIISINRAGHYLGAHSDKHLLYASWENRDSLLVSKEEFMRDIKNNYKEMKRFGIDYIDAPYFLPPYEWYNQNIANWCKEIGLTLINFSPGTKSVSDWTIPELGEQYVNSEKIIASIKDFEKTGNFNLNGFILLMHVGSGPKRSDKIHLKLDLILDYLIEKGYSFHPLAETMK
jgi:peptidoglycan/xylan/chitin deacetylase (PgdA/CDA1 family)